MTGDPDYVNDAPEGAERCQHVFEHSYEYEGRDVKGRMCGLPAATGRANGGTPTCGFHRSLRAEGDVAVGELLSAVREHQYLGGAWLGGMSASEARLEDALLTGAWLHSSDLAGARLNYACLDYANLEQTDLTGAYLNRATAEGGIFRDARLDGCEAHDIVLDGASFHEAHLAGADLHRARAPETWFRGATMRAVRLGEANLYYSLMMEADLTGAELEGTDLRQAVMIDAGLSGAHLRLALLQGADMRGCVLRDADLRNARIGVLEVHDADSNSSTRQATDLRGADLRGALLTGMVLEVEPDLSGAELDCPIRDELCAQDEATWKQVKELHGLSDGERPTFDDCEATYRQLKLNFQESGDYQTAGEFYLREMECKRAKHRERRQWREALVQGVWYRLCGYGERPSWVLGWIAAAVLVFALLQGGLGLTDGAQWVVGPGIEAPSWAGAERFGTSLYFSMVTFTSLGYGDLRPSPGLGRFLAGAEAALGLALMSLLLVTVVRKFSR